jgi:hypothetical protein
VGVRVRVDSESGIEGARENDVDPEDHGRSAPKSVQRKEVLFNKNKNNHKRHLRHELR